MRFDVLKNNRRCKDRYESNVPTATLFTSNFYNKNQYNKMY